MSVVRFSIDDFRPMDFAAIFAPLFYPYTSKFTSTAFQAKAELRTFSRLAVKTMAKVPVTILTGFLGARAASAEDRFDRVGSRARARARSRGAEAVRAWLST